MMLNKSSYKNIQETKYGRKGINTSIAHLGLGAFFKAHFANYIDEYNALGKDIWLIEAVSLKTNNAKKIMNKQDSLYTVHFKDSQSSSFKLIASIKNSLYLGEDRAYIIDLLTSKHTKIISLTITEKGYCFSSSVSGLDVNNADIIHDLNNFKEPNSAIGLICFAMQLRKELGLKGLNIISCDNLPSNGQVLKKVVLDFASFIDENLRFWIEKTCAFPSTMVDRIVPKVTDKSLREIENSIKMQDKAGIICEDFGQFVIENKFINDEMPDLTKVGVLFVDKIKPYENMKLRILNGTHSALSYLGQLLNKKSIFDAISDIRLEIFIRKMLKKEILPSLTKMDGINLDEYADTIIKRYQNPNIVHKTIQICMDGSQKLPQRWLETLKYLMLNDMRYEHFALCLAAWIKFTSSTNLQNESVEVNDPLGHEFAKIWKDSRKSIDIVKAYFSMENIFIDFFIDQEILIKKVADYLQNINNLENMIEELNSENDI